MKKDFLPIAVENPFFEIIKFYMWWFATYIEWIAEEGEIDGS